MGEVEDKLDEFIFSIQWRKITSEFEGVVFLSIAVLLSWLLWLRWGTTHILTKGEENSLYNPLNIVRKIRKINDMNIYLWEIWHHLRACLLGFLIDFDLIAQSCFFTHPLIFWGSTCKYSSTEKYYTSIIIICYGNIIIIH